MLVYCQRHDRAGDYPRNTGHGELGELGELEQTLLFVFYCLSLSHHCCFQKDGESDCEPKPILFGGSEAEISVLEAVEGG